MSEYFSDKDDQSFDMPNDDPSSLNMNQAPVQDPGFNPQQEQLQDDSGFSASAPDTTSQQQDLMYMGIMALIIAVMLYILYAMFFVGTKSDTEKIEPIKVEAVAKPKPMPVLQAPEKPVEADPKTVMMNKDDIEKLQSQSANISDNSSKINEIMQENQYMQSIVRRLREARGKIDDRFSELEAEVDKLSAANDDAANKIKMLEEKIAAMEKPKVVAKKAKPEISYHLQAVVEGRAWIENNKGQNMTIKVGDILSTVL